MMAELISSLQKKGVTPEDFADAFSNLQYVNDESVQKFIDRLKFGLNSNFTPRPSDDLAL